MARTEWHEETWLEVKEVLEQHFTKLGFEVAINNRVRTVNIIHGRKVLAVTDTTNTYYTREGHMVFKD